MFEVKIISQLKTEEYKTKTFEEAEYIVDSFIDMWSNCIKKHYPNLNELYFQDLEEVAEGYRWQLPFGYWLEQEDGIFERQNLITITKKIKKR